MTALVTTSHTEHIHRHAHPYQRLSHKKEIRTEDVCPLMALDEYRGRPMPALPVHCVLESIEKHGAELTRRHILRACDLQMVAHRQDVLSLHLLEKAARSVAAKLARSTHSQRVRRLAAPFPFKDFHVPGDEDFYERRREWRIRRGSKTSTGSSSGDSDMSFDSSQLLLAIAPGHSKVVCVTSSDNDLKSVASDCDTDDPDEASEPHPRPVFSLMTDEDHDAYSTDSEDYNEEEADHTEYDDDEDTELSEGEIECESDIDEDAEICVD